EPVSKYVRAMADTMTWPVAVDRSSASGERGPMALRWMTDSGQMMIPTAFVVDREARVAWIGDPTSRAFDEALSAVVAGTFDRDAAAKKYALDMRRKGVIAKLNEEVTRAKKAKDLPGALRLIDRSIAEDPTFEVSFGIERYFLLLDTKGTTEAAAYG